MPRIHRTSTLSVGKATDNRSTSVSMAPPQPPAGMALSDSRKSSTAKLPARRNQVAASNEVAVAAPDAPLGGIPGTVDGHGAAGSSSGIRAAPTAAAGGNGHRGGQGAAGKGKEDIAAR